MSMSPTASRVYAIVVILGILALLGLGLAATGRRTRAARTEPAAATPAPVRAETAVSVTPLALAGAAEEQKIWHSSAEGLDYVYLPPGQFNMGCVPGDEGCSADERPRHSVSIGSPFWIGRTEVTVSAYQQYVAATGASMPEAPAFNPSWQFGDHPIVNITWHDAAAYCLWAGGRLPGEAEWEYAARGGRDGQKYPWGESCSHDNANYRGSAGADRWAHTAPVGGFAGNGFGLHDMAGNVWEWVGDEWHDNYDGAPADGAVWGGVGATSPGESAAILRGGSWMYNSRLLRCSYRSRWFWPGNRFDDYGFRCIRDALPSASASGENG